MKPVHHPNTRTVLNISALNLILSYCFFFYQGFERHSVFSEMNLYAVCGACLMGSTIVGIIIWYFCYRNYNVDTLDYTVSSLISLSLLSYMMLTCKEPFYQGFLVYGWIGLIACIASIGSFFTSNLPIFPRSIKQKISTKRS